MSERITIRFKDGSTKEFRRKGRPGGSYVKLRLADGWAVVTDGWGTKTCYPADEIASIETAERGMGAT